MASFSPKSGQEMARQDQKKEPRLRRISSLEGKLIIPYVVLTLVLATVGIFVITRLVTSTIRERFLNQIGETARRASDIVVRQEKTNLENLRLIVYTQGVAEAIPARDAATLEELLFPLAVNNGIEALTIIDTQGKEILTLGKNPATNQYLRTQGTDFSSYDLAKNTLSGVSDEYGDKYVELLETKYGLGFFTGAPVYDQNGKIIGGVLVGTRLDTLLANIKSQAQADIILFDPSRKIIATTLSEPDPGLGAIEATAQSLTQQDLGKANNLRMYNRDFQIIYSDLEARGQKLGLFGVILPSNYVVSAEATSRNLFSLMFALGTVAIIVIGYLLSQSIARPILRLRSMTQSVAVGDLDQNIGLDRSDEIGELADAFDVMTLRLRERTTEAARLYAEAVQRNKELAEINIRLQATQLQLAQSEKLGAIGQLAAGIVHDVKNPVTVIKGVAELMLSEDELTPEMEKELSLIRDSALKANNIVSDLLTFARQSRPEMGECDLCETVEATLRLYAYPIRVAHVKVIKDLPDHAVRTVYDNQQIEQVLLNLITNAVQAMPNGGTLRVNLSQSDGVAAIAVQDTGTGIPPENLSRIFDPFFTTKPEGQGTGLGLSVSYGIISNHSGRIEVESIVGVGTTFTVLLPIKHADAMEAPS